MLVGVPSAIFAHGRSSSGRGSRSGGVSLRSCGSVAAEKTRNCARGRDRRHSRATECRRGERRCRRSVARFWVPCTVVRSAT